jgi:hypothetical protein
MRWILLPLLLFLALLLAPSTPTVAQTEPPVPTATLQMIGIPSFATAVDHPIPPFDPSIYLGRGDAFNCDDFRSGFDAQSVLWADPSDPNRLDPDRDGFACNHGSLSRGEPRIP